MVEEGQEPKDMCALIGDKTTYDSLLNGNVGFTCGGLYRRKRGSKEMNCSTTSRTALVRAHEAGDA